MTSRGTDSFRRNNPEPGPWPHLERKLLARKAQLPDEGSDRGGQRYRATDPNARLRPKVFGDKARDHGTDWQGTHENQNEQRHHAPAIGGVDPELNPLVRRLSQVDRAEAGRYQQREHE